MLNDIKKISIGHLLGSGLTGRGVNVAVVDSGINPRHPHIGGIAGGIRISINGDRIAFEDGDFHDEIGHGTACAAVIRKKAPQSSLFSVKIFDQTLATYTSVLIAAIRWCIDWKMDVVNLSLGTRNEKSILGLREVCRLARQKGMIVVAASEDGQATYPASFPEVFGVAAHPACSEDVLMYSGNSSIRFLASGIPRPLPGLPPPMNFGGASIASAHLSGIMALLRERYFNCDLEEIEKTLINDAVEFLG